MKVLKRGRKQSGWSIEQKCTGDGNEGGGCGAKLLVEAADLFHTHHYVHVEHDIFTTFKCPQCGVMTDLPKNLHVPSYVRSQIPNDYPAWLKRQGATVVIPLNGMYRQEGDLAVPHQVELKKGRYNLVLKEAKDAGVDSTDH